MSSPSYLALSISFSNCAYNFSVSFTRVSANLKVKGQRNKGEIGIGYREIVLLFHAPTVVKLYFTHVPVKKVEILIDLVAGMRYISY